MTRILLCTLCAALLAACGSSGGDTTLPPAGGSGTVRLLLSDTPVESADAVVVSIAKVVAFRDVNGTTVDETLVDVTDTYDLLDLQNGVTAELGVKPLPVGEYLGLRLYLSGGGSPAGPPGSPTPNYITIAGEDYPLRVPSGVQSGIKMSTAFSVEADELIELLIDFNVRKSVVKRGKKDEYLLKPSLKLIRVVISGSISGSAVSSDDDVDLADGVVSAQQKGTGDTFFAEVLSAAVTGAGTFLLKRLEQGTYDLVASAPGFAPELIEDVEVEAEEDTAGVSFTLDPADTGDIEGAAPDGDAYTVVLLWEGHYLTQTASDGTYAFEDVAVGTYDVVLLEDGLEVDRAENVEVTADTTTSDVDLSDS